jgi:hypothetical protein
MMCAVLGFVGAVLIRPSAVKVADAATGAYGLTVSASPDSVIIGNHGGDITVNVNVVNNTMAINFFQAMIHFDHEIFEYVGYATAGELSHLSNPAAMAGSNPALGRVIVSFQNDPTPIAQTNFLAGRFRIRVRSGVTPPAGASPITIGTGTGNAGANASDMTAMQLGVLPSSRVDGAVTFTAASNDANLTGITYSGMTITGGAPTWSASVAHHFPGTTPNATKTAWGVLSVATLRSGLTMSPNATAVFTSVSGATINATQIILVPGLNTINIAVTSQSGGNTQNYTLNITRAQGEDNNSLADGAVEVRVRGNPISVSRATNIFTAGAVAFADREHISIVVTLNAAHNQTMTIGGQARTSGQAFAVPLASITNFGSGFNDFAIVVTPERVGAAVGNFSVRIPVEAGENIARLSDLSVFYQSGGSDINVPFTFVATTFSYSIHVPSGVTQVFVVATPQGLGSVPVAFRTATLVAQNIGLINILVTAQNGTTTQNYQISVGHAVELSDDNRIHNIVVVGHESRMTFIETVANYEFSVAHSISSVNIVVTRNHGVFVSGGGNNLPLEVGVNTFVIFAVNELNEEGTRYTIRITREARDFVLQKLEVLNFEFEQPFDKNVRIHNLRLPTSVGSITIVMEFIGSEEGYTVTGRGTHTLTNIGRNNPDIIVVLVTDDMTNERLYEFLIFATREAPSSMITIIAFVIAGTMGAMAIVFCSLWLVSRKKITRLKKKVPKYDNIA